MVVGVIWVLLLFFSAFNLGVKCQVSFGYENFPEFLADFILSGDANISNGALLLTGDRTFSFGRAMRRQTIQLCNSSGFMASFVTDFTFLIQKKESDLVNADGFAFTIAPNATAPSNESYGRWMGLFDKNTNGFPSNNLAAVEFDTFRNQPGMYPAFQDIDNNHVGLNLNSMLSISSSSLYPFQVFLGSGAPMAARIDYNATAKRLRVYVSDNVTRTRVGSLVLEHSFDICSIISKENTFVGFSAGSGSKNIDFHKILSWKFDSSELFLPVTEDPGSRGDTQTSRAIILGSSLSSAFLVLLGIIGVTTLVALSRRRKAQENDLVQLPHSISYADLSAGTNNFSKDNLLGRGGFGSVYKGVLPNDQSLVAVKRISKDSQQGEREFLAEVQIISQLSHRNLVKLRGWCKQKRELILVYDFMPRGSLDRALFDPDEPVLPWEVRYRILCGLAAALLYIHEDWDQQVVHRDIKSSNVMLDADFNARLGDFGLARALERDRADNMESTTIAGTLGYMAPEIFQTFSFTPTTDVYSFGMVALEVVCGRKVVTKFNTGKSLLLPWVQDCYMDNRLLDTVDFRLNGDFDAGEASRALKTALMCVDLNPARRPSMRPVHFILTGDITLTV
ncbi:L-type lectin-domain containing receptor kinase S.4 [Selaginella moellendorffii]|nr:L-type lectin-domain containing receptor kinase S.4 [Selaginella moellendorffii]|eukprot:XP_002985562.2 L-type lectin-domain containing receptor kinase S.4 [Selaginella moellendorffii]